MNWFASRFMALFRLSSDSFARFCDIDGSLGRNPDEEDAMAQIDRLFLFRLHVTFDSAAVVLAPKHRCVSGGTMIHRAAVQHLVRQRN